jgi:hypothetical protein
MTSIDRNGIIIGMWLSLHKDPAAPDDEMIRARSTGTRRNVLTV